MRLRIKIRTKRKTKKTTKVTRSSHHHPSLIETWCNYIAARDSVYSTMAAPYFMAVKSQSLHVTINLLHGFYETAMIYCFPLFIIDIATLFVNIIDFAIIALIVFPAFKQLSRDNLLKTRLKALT
jgi:hypothetical protein